MVMHIDNNIQWLLSGDAKAAGLPVAAAAPVTLDSGAGDPVQASADSDYVSQNVAVMTGAAIVEWLETMPEELGVGVDGAAGETFADRLYAMMVGIADEDQSAIIKNLVSLQAIYHAATSLAKRTLCRYPEKQLTLVFD
jgi:hypothetical protein